MFNVKSGVYQYWMSQQPPASSPHKQNNTQFKVFYSKLSTTTTTMASLLLFIFNLLFLLQSFFDCYTYDYGLPSARLFFVAVRLIVVEGLFVVVSVSSSSAAATTTTMAVPATMVPAVLFDSSAGHRLRESHTTTNSTTTNNGTCLCAPPSKSECEFGTKFSTDIVPPFLFQNNVTSQDDVLGSTFQDVANILPRTDSDDTSNRSNQIILNATSRVHDFTLNGNYLNATATEESTEQALEGGTCLRQVQSNSSDNNIEDILELNALATLNELYEITNEASNPEFRLVENAAVVSSNSTKNDDNAMACLLQDTKRRRFRHPQSLQLEYPSAAPSTAYGGANFGSILTLTFVSGICNGCICNDCGSDGRYFANGVTNQESAMEELEDGLVLSSLPGMVLVADHEVDSFFECGGTVEDFTRRIILDLLFCDLHFCQLVQPTGNISLTLYDYADNNGSEKALEGGTSLRPMQTLETPSLAPTDASNAGTIFILLRGVDSTCNGCPNDLFFLTQLAASGGQNIMAKGDNDFLFGCGIQTLGTSSDCFCPIGGFQDALFFISFIAIVKTKNISNSQAKRCKKATQPIKKCSHRKKKTPPPSPPLPPSLPRRSPRLAAKQKKTTLEPLPPPPLRQSARIAAKRKAAAAAK